MRGRITEEHLEQAERSFPGISDVYDAMRDKPLTFLNLVWIYEELVQGAVGHSDTDWQQ